jgi:hypothetical protein
MARKKLLDLRFVICGSMTFYSNILEVHRILMDNKVPTIIPANDDSDFSSISRDEYTRYKKSVSLKHIKEIRRKETLGIIVINNEKHQIKDYIGGNTFAEIAIAFSHGKKIFLLNEIPDFFIDELRAWGVIELKGCLDILIDYYRGLDVWQPTLFDSY